MPVTAPKCKLCGETHWSPVCPNIGKKGAARTKPDIKAIEAKAASAGTKKPKRRGKR